MNRQSIVIDSPGKLRMIEGMEVRMVGDSGRVVFQDPDTGFHYWLDMSQECFEDGNMVLKHREKRLLKVCQSVKKEGVNYEGFT